MSARRSRFSLAPSPEPSRVVVVGGGAPAPVADWLGVLGWLDLELLARCTARQVGAGHELAYTLYDDDGEAADDPFVGVKLVAVYRDGESVVFARDEYDAIVADICDIAIARPPDPQPEWWESFLADAATVRSRIG